MFSKLFNFLGRGNESWPALAKEITQLAEDGSFEEAHRALERALTEAGSDKRKEAWALHWLGYMERKLRRDSAAEAHLRSAISLFTDLRENDDAIESKYQLSKLFLRQRRFADIVAAAEDGLKSKEIENDTGRVEWFKLVLAIGYAEIGNDQQAQELFGQIEPMLEAGIDKFGYEQLNYYLGLLDYKTGNLESALEHLEEVVFLEQAKHEPDAFVLSKSASLLAELYRSLDGKRAKDFEKIAQTYSARLQT